MSIIDPDKLDLLADWFDVYDSGTEINLNKNVQADLRQWAKYLRTSAKIITLCGSTKFWNTMAKVAIEESAKGHIVLSANINFKSPWHNQVLDNLDLDPARTKELVDQLHFRKIDISDEVIILNVGGYVGDSTRNEIAYAIKNNKPLRFIEPVQEGDL